MSKRFIHFFALAATILPFALLLLGASVSDSAITRNDFTQATISDLLTNFSRAFDLGIGAALLNSLAVCIPMVILQLGSSILAAFAFARFEFKGKRLLYSVLIGTYLIPEVITVLPLFLLMSELGLKGTPVGILLPFVLFSPYAIVLLRERFAAIPRELIDQARIDGLGSWGLLMRVSLPLTRSFVVLLAVITFVSTWNAYLWPRLIAGTDWPTITVAIAGLQGQYDSHWNLVLSATLLAAIPALSAFFIAKKNLVRSPLAELEI